MKKFIYALAIFCFFISFSVFAQETQKSPEPQENQEVFIGERIDVGCFNIWLHADGKTWQDTEALVK